MRRLAFILMMLMVSAAAGGHIARLAVLRQAVAGVVEPGAGLSEAGYNRQSENASVPGEAEPAAVTADFVAYMKSVLNPFDFGLRGDGRFYPYSTRYGRRIGYGRVVEDRGLFARGETQAEARLRAGLQALEPKLAAHVTQRHPGVAWAALPRTAREILLDHAYTEGIERLPDELVAAVVRGDWRTMLDRHLHVRAPDGWPDYVKNAAFGRRWIYGETALVPRRK